MYVMYRVYVATKIYKVHISVINKWFRKIERTLSLKTINSKFKRVQGNISPFFVCVPP